MSTEIILKVGEGGFVLKEKGDKKYIAATGPRGNLILTDKRLIFAKSSVGFGKRALVNVSSGALIGGYIGKTMDMVKPEELDEALKLPDSFSIPVSDLVDAKAESGKLKVSFKSPEKITSCTFLVVGGVLSSPPRNDWVEAIKGAGAVVLPTQSVCPICKGPLTYIWQYKRWYCYKDQKYV